MGSASAEGFALRACVSQLFAQLGECQLLHLNLGGGRRRNDDNLDAGRDIDRGHPHLATDLRNFEIDFTLPHNIMGSRDPRCRKEKALQMEGLLLDLSSIRRLGS